MPAGLRDRGRRRIGLVVGRDRVGPIWRRAVEHEALAVLGGDVEAGGDRVVELVQRERRGVIVDAEERCVVASRSEPSRVRVLGEDRGGAVDVRGEVGVGVVGGRGR